MNTATNDPIEILRRLTAEELRTRLEQLHREQAALRVLLRSAAAREGVTRRRVPAQTGGVA
jgi:ribosomal protein L29